MAFIASIARPVLIVLTALSLAGQEQVPLARFAERTGPELRPALHGVPVRIRGTVAMHAMQLPDYQLMPVQDEEGRGLALEDPGPRFQGLRPGDRVEVTGIGSMRAGLPVVKPAEIRKTGTGSPPAPQRFPIQELLRFGNLGRYVVTEGEVLYTGTNAGGEVMSIAASRAVTSVFLPRSGAPDALVFGSFRPGDKVRVFGMSSQYSARPPYDRNFQIIVPSGSAVQAISRAWPVSPAVVGGTAGLLLITILIFWSRERVLKRQRRILRGIIALSEEVVAASSAREIAQKLDRDVPRLFDGGSTDLLLFKASDDTLERVLTDSRSRPLTVPGDAPPGTLPGVLALCLRNRSPLWIPDTRKSPLLEREDSELPASGLFIPTLAQGELMGVLAVYSRRRIERTPDLEMALQHLGNQVAASLHLQERQQMRDQLLRSDKMAATGQLISGLATELHTPLDRIRRVARSAAEQQANRPELREIAAEAGRGLEMLDHMLSFSRMEQRQAKPLDLHALVSSLIDLRVEERERKRLTCENTLPVSPVLVRADQGQLEQALLTMLVHAEHVAADSPSRAMQVGSRVVGRKVLLSFEAERIGSADPLPPHTAGDQFGLSVAQMVAQSHGGDLRTVRPRGAIRLELELPIHMSAAADEAPAAPARSTRALTCLIVEPDVASQRKLIALLAARGHRGIPAQTAEEAADMAQRMPFDAIFCASRVAGLTWLELYKRIHRRVGAFALLSDAWDSDAAQTLKASEGRVLTRPLSDSEVDDFLARVEVRADASAR